MIVRKATETDFPALVAILHDETGTGENGLHTGESFVVENGEIWGFFTIAEAHGFPMLQHFCSAKDKRTPALSRAMMRAFRHIISSHYHSKKALLSAPKGREHIKTVIEYYYKTTPYGESPDNFWYLVEV